jgi:hypothetical protein
MRPAFLVELLHNQVVVIPLIVLSVQLMIKLIYNIDEHDWYGLYISLSGLGIDLSLLVLVIYLGVAVTDSHRIVRKLIPSAGTENEAVFAHLVVVFMIGTLLALCIWCGRRAERVGRERFSISWKEPTVNRLFIARIATLMLSSVQQETVYHRSEGSCVPGAVWTVCSATAGLFLTAVFLKLVV